VPDSRDWRIAAARSFGPCRIDRASSDRNDDSTGTAGGRKTRAKLSPLDDRFTFMGDAVFMSDAVAPGDQVALKPALYEVEAGSQARRGA
jgi:hypothetical protein